MSMEEYLMVFVLICLGGLLLIVVLMEMVENIKDFKEIKRYIKMEIERTQGRERKYWISKKRRLWLSLIPFVRYK